MEASATRHGLEAYTPLRREQRRGAALCLSGGGFRAALFHLGAARRLNETGVLGKVTTVSSVSGGAIFAAHLAERVRPWPEKDAIVEGWEERVAAPFRAFVKNNIRTPAILRRLLPWNWAHSSAAVEALAARFERDLTRLRLAGLPERPRFVFSATDMAFGVDWVFERTGVGDDMAGYAAPPAAWPVGRAVAASACFPPVFNPLPVGLPPDAFSRGEAPQGAGRDAAIRGMRLSDGGLYDNLGLEPVWRDHAVVLVSDGGATFDFGADRGLLWRLRRYTEIVGASAGAARKRWLIGNFIAGEMTGAYWGIGSAVDRYEVQTPGYSDRLIDEVVSEVRTDMDAFAEAEIAALENHGYLLAEAAVTRHAPDLIAPGARPLTVPHPAWMDEPRVRKGLATSHRLKLPFGRW